ncbi:MAG: hypothetical protein Q8R12_04565 [bacterium]|nr:hypothetical protein [bacterium]
MPNGNRPQRRPGGSPNFINQGRWILLFLIIAAVILLQARGGLFSGSGGIRVGSPSSSGTIEEERVSEPLPPPKPLPPLQG